MPNFRSTISCVWECEKRQREAIEPRICQNEQIEHGSGSAGGRTSQRRSASSGAN